MGLCDHIVDDALLLQYSSLPLFCFLMIAVANAFLLAVSLLHRLFLLIRIQNAAVPCDRDNKRPRAFMMFRRGRLHNNISSVRQFRRLDAPVLIRKHLPDTVFILPRFRF